MVGSFAVSALVRARPGVTDFEPKVTSSLVVTAGVKPSGVWAEARLASAATAERAVRRMLTRA